MRVSWVCLVALACTTDDSKDSPSGTDTPQVDSTTVDTTTTDVSVTDSDTDSDADSDADADVDTDSDADTDTADTAPPPLAWNGSYAGTVTADITFQRSPLGPVTLYSCTGPTDITVDDTATPVISGSGTCVAGPETWTLTWTGELPADPMAAGTLDAAHPLMGFSASWQGAFAAGTGGSTLTATAMGSMGGPPWVTWDLTLAVTSP